MKKVVIAAVGLSVLTIGAYVVLGPGNSNTGTGTQTSGSGAIGTGTSGSTGIVTGKSTKQGDLTDGVAADQSGNGDTPTRPATELYKTAAEALDAIRKASVDFDDAVLDQFTMLPEDCAWCNDLYASLRGMAFEDGLSENQRRFYADILAVSGRTENAAALIKRIESSPPDKDEEVFDYADALGMVAGNDAFMKFLGEHLATKDEILKKGLISGLTNQGTAVALEQVYNGMKAEGDTGKKYDGATGLDAAVPLPDAFPFLKEVAGKRDEYSHLAVDALFNSGAEGARAVFDMLRASKDPQADKAMLKDAIRHVFFDEETEALFKEEAASNTNPTAAEFAKTVLESLKEGTKGYFDDDAADE